jgi:hypothetical protein
MIAESIALGTHTAPINPQLKKKPAKHRRRRHPVAKPDPKVMAAINNELGTRVNFDKLADYEGGQALLGYIPGHTAGNKNDGDKVAGISGVTIATGFDIGQWSVLDLSKKLDLPQALQDKYKRFCDKHQITAVNELEREGLQVTKPEADETDMKVQRFHLIAAVGSWDTSAKPYKAFRDLTMAQQTVILSRTYHQGTGMPKKHISKAFYSAAQSGDWDAAIKALRNYGGGKIPKWYQTRVNQEADYLAQDLTGPVQANKENTPKVPRP